jgi:hypothetical protein
MAEKKLDLRKKPPAPPPPPPAPPKAIPLQDMLGPSMFQPGQVLDPRYMTDFERKQLASIGWNEGTPVPGNAAELIAAARQEAAAEGLLPVPADTPPLSMPATVDISRLPSAKQQELREALRQAGTFQEQFRAQEAAAASTPVPGVADAMRVAHDVSRSHPPNLGVSVVDDRPRAAPKPAPEPPPQPAVEPDPAPSVEPPIGDLSDTGAIGITHCPHCSWDLKRPDPSTPTDDDKRVYLMAALAGPGHRFTRDVAMLGGTVKVGYRELTGHEADAALTQIADDIRKARIVGDGEWWQRLMDYRMTQSIGYIEFQGVGRVHDGVDLDEIESDDGNPTPYPALVSHLLSTVLHSESLRRAIGQGFMRFQRLCEKLEANADEPSFWEGIGSLR